MMFYQFSNFSFTDVLSGEPTSFHVYHIPGHTRRLSQSFTTWSLW